MSERKRVPKKAWVTIAAMVVVAVGALPVMAAALTPTPTGTAVPPATPSPASTPWPAPTDLRVSAGPKAILNADGSFIPPDQRVYEAAAEWDAARGFTGRYEVQWARQRRGESGDPGYSHVANVLASAAVDGRLRVAENITFADATGARWCFRVRTVADAPPAPVPGSDVIGPRVETGPWAEACSQLPPTSGPGPLAAPAFAGMGMHYETTDQGGDYVSVATFEWSAVPGFEGAYEVERAYVPVTPGGANAGVVSKDLPMAFSVVATVPSTAVRADGRLAYGERVPYPVMWDTPPCYRVRAVRGDERGPYSEVRCAFLATDQRPPAGRTWLLAPARVRMWVNYLSPEGTTTDYDTVATFGWLPVPGFEGVYEVERAYVPPFRAGGAPDRAAPHTFERIASVPSAPGPDGWVTFADRVPYVRMWDTPPCYRVQAVRGNERGPYSESACAFLAPHSAPPAGRTPIAPDVGSGVAPAGPPGEALEPWLLLPGSLAVAGAAGAVWSALPRKRGR